MPSADDPMTLRCPEGRPCRLALVHAQARLVYCVPLEPGPCPHVMAFEGTRYCRALLHRLPRTRPAGEAEG
jgi:hypothetical protein